MHPYFNHMGPAVMGHRGAAGAAPENTLAAFARGLEDGASALESDVQLTRDGVPVLCHDTRVDRCTNGTGLVRAFDLTDLQTLDAGFRFHLGESDETPERGRGHRIPTLEEALNSFPDAKFNLELKGTQTQLIPQAVETIRIAGRAETTLLTAAEDRMMQPLRMHVRETGVELALGASSGEVAAFAVAVARGKAPLPGPMALQIPPDFAGQPLVTPEFIAAAHAHAMHVHVWTINDRREMARLLDLGVDGIVTDYPARLTRLIQDRSAAGASADPATELEQ